MSLLALLLFAALPPDPVSLIAPIATPDPTALAGTNLDGVSAELVDVAGQPFAKALRIDVRKQPSNYWDVEYRAPILRPLRADHTLWVSAYFKAESDPEAADIRLQIMTTGPPWQSLYEGAAILSENGWYRFMAPFHPSRNADVNTVRLALRFGGAVQTVLLGPVELLDHGPNVPLDDLPRSKSVFPSLSLDGPWFQEAHDRIGRHRTAAFRFEVVDAEGQPVPIATVRIEQTRNAFLFGTAVNAPTFAGKTSPEIQERYRAAILENFNSAVIENGLKWPGWENPDRRIETEATVSWLREHGLRVRGHNIIWPGEQYLPRRILRLADDHDALRREIDAHIRDVVGAMRGQLIHWDVVNEPFTNHWVQDRLGESVLADWFQLARATDPNARLYINDYAILSDSANPESPHRLAYERTIQALLDASAPLDGIGLQGHFGAKPPTPDQMLATLDRYGRFGVPLCITEFDVNTQDEAYMADLTRAVLILAYSHPAVEGFLMWGFWDSRHWKHAAPLFRDDWSLKPSGQVWRDLVLDAWKTRASGLTDSSGHLTLTGHHGEYAITATQDGRTLHAVATLAPGGVDLKLQFPRENGSIKASARP